MRVAHVITGLGRGGAEALLLALLAPLQARGFHLEIAALRRGGALVGAARASGVQVSELGIDEAPGVIEVARLLARWRQSPPAVVHTWLYHASLVGGLLGRLAGAKVVWGVHQTRLAAADTRLTTRVVAGLARRASRVLPDHIVCCATAARRVHLGRGYPEDKTTVIANGVDLSRFRPDSTARARLRRELGLSDAALVIGMLARFHPQKDHETFAAAATLLALRQQQARFLLCGDGTDDPRLVSWFAAPPLRGRARLLGGREDSAALLCACDLVTLTSVSEALPLVLLEAMAAGVPCVATDVGDCRKVIGDSGRVVPAREPAALAEAWAELGADVALRRELGGRARRRIVEHYSLDRCADAYAELYTRLGEQRRAVVRVG